MGVRWLLNFVLLAIPIGVTLGILLSLQSHRVATGQDPLFVDNSVSRKQYCQKTIGVSPPSKGVHFTLNPNQWGWDAGDPGSLCMNITQFNNQTYSSKETAPAFSVTWQYPPGPETQPVHAFPNAKLDSGVFPGKINTIDTINFDVAWSYAIGSASTTSTDQDALTQDSVNTNVAIDMFFDSDQATSEDTDKAAVEVMVWFARYGTATDPIGFAAGSVVTEVVNGTTFDLYAGPRNADDPTGAQVFTWIASKPTQTFTGDIMTFVSKLTAMDQTGYPTDSDYLGYMSLGSETYYSNVNVTFTVPRLSIDVQTK